MKYCLIKKLTLIFVLSIYTISAYSIPIENNYMPTSDVSVLMAQVDTAQNDSEKLTALKNVSIYLALNQPNKTALEYIDKTADLARKLKEPQTIIQTYLLYAKIYIEENKIHDAYTEIDRALTESTNKSYKNLIGQSLIIMAYFYKRLGFFGYSLEYCLKADQYIPDLGTTGKFYLYIELGDVYFNLNEYNQAINTYFKAFDIANDSDAQILIAHSIAKISSVYIVLGQYEKAITYLQKAYNIAIKIDNSDFVKILILSQLAQAYEEQKKNSEALDKYIEVLKISREHGFEFYTSQALLNIANIYIKTNNYKMASKYLKDCDNICKKSPTLYDIQLELYNSYCNYYKAVNNYKLALSYKEKCDIIKDKLFIDKVANRIAILETKFRHEQSIKSNELLKKSIALKEEKIKSDQRFILFLIIISLLILLLTALFIILYYNKRKYIAHLNDLNKELELVVQKRTESLKRTVDNLRNEIKERKKLQKLVEKISDREQRRIGHDIHDSLGQILVGISFGLQAISRKLKKRDQEELSEEASVLAESAAKACTQARDLAKLLAPVELKEEGLDNALEKLAIFYRNTYKIDCIMTIERKPNTNLNMQMSTNIYRIIQEATNNAIKHANADKIEILLDLTKSTAILSVQDNGKGLSVKDKEKFTGMGLKIMETRSELLNGKLDLISLPGKGTLIKCAFPLNYKPLI